MCTHVVLIAKKLTNYIPSTPFSCITRLSPTQHTSPPLNFSPYPHTAPPWLPAYPEHLDNGGGRQPGQLLNTFSWEGEGQGREKGGGKELCLVCSTVRGPLPLPHLYHPRCFWLQISRSSCSSASHVSLSYLPSPSHTHQDLAVPHMFCQAVKDVATGMWACAWLTYINTLTLYTKATCNMIYEVHFREQVIVATVPDFRAKGDYI